MTSIESITTHLIVADAAQASAWYQSAFGAEELSRITLTDGRLIHVELRIGPMTFMLADAFPEHGAAAPSEEADITHVFYLQTADVDGLWQRAVDAGAVETRPLSDTFWGEREGQLRDPYRYRWGLSQHTRDVPIDEMTVLAREAFASS